MHVELVVEEREKEESAFNSLFEMRGKAGGEAGQRWERFQFSI